MALIGSVEEFGGVASVAGVDYAKTEGVSSVVRDPDAKAWWKKYLLEGIGDRGLSCRSLSSFCTSREVNFAECG